MDLDKTIQYCKQQKSDAQKCLYDHYAPLFMSISLRYMKNKEDAEDALIQSFYTIFSKIDQFKNKGSFEGWMKRILINQCLMLLRKKNNFHLSIESNELDFKAEQIDAQDQLAYEDVLALLNELSPGYRTVFNLYVIEGYKHREIAEQLGISINTSKSQLILAKKRMQTLIKKKDNVRYA